MKKTIRRKRKKTRDLKRGLKKTKRRMDAGMKRILRNVKNSIVRSFYAVRENNNNTENPNDSIGEERHGSGTLPDWNFNNGCDDKICIECEDTGGKIVNLTINGEVLSLEPGTGKSGRNGSVVFYVNANLRVAVKNFHGCSGSYIDETILIEMIKRRFKGYPEYLVPSFTVSTKDCYYSVMYSKATDLRALLVREELILTQENRISIFNQILGGILELAMKDLYLTDMKPENVLIDLLNDKVGGIIYKVWLCDIGGIVAHVEKNEMDIFVNLIRKLKETKGNTGIIADIHEYDKIADKYDIDKTAHVQNTEIGVFTFPPIGMEEGQCSYTDARGEYSHPDEIMFMNGFYHQICMIWLFVLGTKEDITFLDYHANYWRISEKESQEKVEEYRGKLPVAMRPYFLDTGITPSGKELLSKSLSPVKTRQREGSILNYKFVKSVFDSFFYGIGQPTTLFD